MGLILKEIVERTYRANFCSCSMFLCVLFTLIIIIVPFFLAASTHGFWSSSLSYYEQPTVLYRNELILAALTLNKQSSGSSIQNLFSTSIFSTSGALQQLYSEDLIAADVQSNFIDQNADLKPDSYSFNLSLPVLPKTLRSIKVLIQFDYRLRERINMDMTSLAIIDIDLPTGASEVYVDGSLNLKQRKTLKTSRVVRKVYNETLFNFDRPVDGFWNRILRRYLDRNETTQFEYDYNTKAPTDKNGVKIGINLRIPIYQEVIYHPMFLQNLKFAWIQYLSLAIPIWYIVSSFSHYIFSQQIFETSVEVKKL